MYGREKRRNIRNTAIVMDVIHIVIGIVIVILGVISFLNPEGNMVLFPAIFLFAAVLNFINGIYRIRQSGREKKKKLSGVALIGLGLLLIFITMVSAISIWWG